MIEAGDIFFTKTIKTRTKDGVTYTLKGHGIGVLLGIVQPKTSDPTLSECHELIGSIGLVGLDDVEAACGKEAMDKVIAFVIEKNKKLAKKEKLP